MAAAKKKKPETVTIPPFTCVVVVWEDAWTSANAQFSGPDEALTYYKPMIRRSIGYWVAKTEDVVAIAIDDDRNDPSTDKDNGGISYIPTGMVRSIQIVAQDPQRKRRRASAAN